MCGPKLEDGRQRKYLRDTWDSQVRTHTLTSLNMVRRTHSHSCHTSHSLSYSHQHLSLSLLGEVTPGVTQTEYELRRQCLASLIESRAPDSSHVLVILSHPVRYMTNDIPYLFHQNQDFLYLTGVLEPDCALVMYGSPRPDRTLLFVPPRDPGRELWDGPRSGRDGAAALTGIQTVHSIEELGSVLNGIKGKDGREDRPEKCRKYTVSLSFFFSPSLSQDL